MQTSLLVHECFGLTVGMRPAHALPMLVHLMFRGAVSLSDWQHAATEVAQRAAAFDSIEEEARASTIRWAALLPRMALGWSNRDLVRLPSEDSTSGAYATRGESWQAHVSWDLSAWLREPQGASLAHLRLQLYEKRHALATEIARNLAAVCEPSADAPLARLQLNGLTAGWSATHPPPCSAKQVAK